MKEYEEFFVLLFLYTFLKGEGFIMKKLLKEIREANAAARELRTTRLTIT
jgi:hypothetical protein